MVDYDLRRRELEVCVVVCSHWMKCALYYSVCVNSCTTGSQTKQKVTDQKLQQAEELYSQTKLLYDEITDELYEELPTFFDRSVLLLKFMHVVTLYQLPISRQW